MTHCFIYPTNLSDNEFSMQLELHACSCVDHVVSMYNEVNSEYVLPLYFHRHVMIRGITLCYIIERYRTS